MKILREEDMKINRWSGGLTKELYIYPEDSQHASRNFKFRISIATTEEENSVFTRLPGVQRVISILKGKMVISHKNRYEKTLLPYEIEKFHGDWETSSSGKVKDFNLMIKDSEGDFFFKELMGEGGIEFPAVEGLFFIYCIEGEVEVNEESLKEGELFLDEKKPLRIFSERAKIFYGYVEI
ncbi:MAG: HutD/Ves family protein [Fusobacteriaceae bacterium]